MVAHPCDANPVCTRLYSLTLYLMYISMNLHLQRNIGSMNKNNNMYFTVTNQYLQAIDKLSHKKRIAGECN